MKYVFQVFALTLAGLLVVGTILHTVVTVFKVETTLVQVLFVEEILLIGLILLLNRYWWKEKLLFEKYSVGKSIGLLAYAGAYALLAIGGAIVKGRPLGLVFLYLTTALCVGFFEEYVFRGLILGGLIARGKSIAFAIVVSSVLFGLLHGINVLHNNPMQVLLQMLYVIPMGILFALIYLKSNNLLYVMITHAMVDFSAFTLSNGSVNSSGQTIQGVFVLSLFFATLIIPFWLTGKTQFAKFRERIQK
ncbi:MAG: CPBP family intramembrane metalloprotease [Streptococcaceae bacterium]|jgi:membrane protease YdiL (CAAX protease family)|nr:CPBP family intramembrane metalloprotease [Streptococcaceae bacterium]